MRQLVSIKATTCNYAVSRSSTETYGMRFTTFYPLRRRMVLCWATGKIAPIPNESFCIVLYNVVDYILLYCFFSLYCVMLYAVVLYGACCAVLYRVVLCCMVLCCVELCCMVLCLLCCITLHCICVGMFFTCILLHPVVIKSLGWFYFFLLIGKSHSQVIVSHCYQLKSVILGIIYNGHSSISLLSSKNTTYWAKYAKNHTKNHCYKPQNHTQTVSLNS